VDVALKDGFWKAITLGHFGHGAQPERGRGQQCEVLDWIVANVLIDDPKASTEPETNNIISFAIVAAVLAVVIGAYPLCAYLPRLSGYLPKISIAQIKPIVDAARETVDAASVQPPLSVATNAGVNARGEPESAEGSSPDAVAPMANSEVTMGGAANEPASAASVQQPPPPANSNGSDGAHEKFENAEALAAHTVTPTANDSLATLESAPASSVVAPPKTGNVLETISRGSPKKDAQFYYKQGIASYRNGDLHVAIADFDRAIRLDPNFEDAYVDRGIALYRMRRLNRAFADIAQAMRIENSHRPSLSPLPKAHP